MRGRVWIRNAVVIAFALLITLGPAYRQVLRGEEKMMPRWAMFSGMAVNFLALDISYEKSGEPRAPVPSEMLFPDPQPPKKGEGIKPRWAVRVRKVTELERLLSRTCKELGPEATLYVNARLAHRVDGWRPVKEDEQYECAEMMKERRSRRNHGNGRR